MDKYRRYSIESPRTGGGSVLGFFAVVGLTLGALAVGAAETPPRLAQTVFIEPAKAEAPAPAVEALQPAREASGAAQSDVPDEAPTQDVALACSLNACADAYRSFRASDCTFQPYDGPRRMCTR
jgi:hypothetical protein